MGKPSAPPPPDYTPIAQASQAQTALSAEQLQFAREAFGVQNAQADRSYAMSQDALNWAKSETDKNSALNKTIADRQMAVQDESLANARKAQGRYEGVYQPLEDQAVKEAASYDSAANREKYMSRASAGVAQNFDAQRIAAAQNLESFGVDPSSTRYAALDASMRVAQAAAQAGAANMAGDQVEATARQLRANAINVGRGLPSDVNAGNQTSIGAGSAAGNLGLAGQNIGANTMGTGVQYGALGAQQAGNGIGALNAGTGAINAGTGAVSAWGNTLNNGYQNQLGAFQASQSASSGIGSILGTGLGFASMAGFSEGGAVPAELSPSQGRAVDDIHAALTPGEFVVPRDVVQWKGEEFFQKLATKSREDRKANSPARPQAVPAPTGPAVFTSKGAVEE